MPSMEDIDVEKAEQLKTEGNAFFKEGNFDGALKSYTSAIACNSENHLLWTNRSMTYAALDQWENSLKDAEKALDLCPSSAKAYYRICKAHFELSNYKKALEFCKRGIKADCDHGTVKLFQKIEKASNEILQNEKSKDSLTIRDFVVKDELGKGNFSSIYLVQHKASQKIYALKIIDKSEVNRLKRRHENIEKEILMEKRALLKLSGHPGIIELYATFQDFSNLYYMIEYCENGELWKRLLVHGHPVGAFPTLSKFWISELVLAIEYIHSKGLVHRDIKPENILLTSAGHIKVIDFGTCKDLVETDLNGLEFVGTPQYMSPQAVDSEPQGKEADFWALGCCLFQFLAGQTPFHAPSPYLCFLKIRRGMVRFPRIIGEVEKSLIVGLLKRNPFERLGSDARGGYQTLKTHPYFSSIDFNSLNTSPAIQIPKLSELCIRAVGDFIEQWGNNTVFIPNPLPININVSLLSINIWEHLKHYLNRVNALSHPKVFRLFNPSSVDAKCRRADFTSKEYLGLDWNRQGQWNESFFFVHITNPMVGKTLVQDGTPHLFSEIAYIEQSVKVINRLRPSFVTISGNFVSSQTTLNDDESLHAFQKAICKISETIPVMYIPGPNIVGCKPNKADLEVYRKRFGSDYYGFWWSGLRGLVINSPLLFQENSEVEDSCEQVDWLIQELELAQLNAQHLFVFSHHSLLKLNAEKLNVSEVGQDVSEEIRIQWLRKLILSKVKAIFSSASGSNCDYVMKRLPHELKMGQGEGSQDEFETLSEMVSQLHHISTASMSQPIAKQERGLRVVKVFENYFETDFFSLNSVPASIDLTDKSA